MLRPEDSSPLYYWPESFATGLFIRELTMTSLVDASRITFNTIVNSSRITFTALTITSRITTTSLDN